MKVSIEAIQYAYGIAKRCLAGSLSFTEAYSNISEHTGMAANSAKDYINNLKYMLEGKCYARTLNTYYSTSIATLLASAANNHYTQHSTVNGAFGECSNRIVAVNQIFSNLEAALKKHFAHKKDIIVSLQKTYNNYLNNYSRFFNANYRTTLSARLTNEIKANDPSYVEPTVEPTPPKSGCYVATAVYGSYDCPQVWTLRRFRDNTLAETWHGRAFIRTYYAISPTLVKWFGKTEWFKNLWKPALDRMVEKLNGKGVEDTPYDDRAW